MVAVTRRGGRREITTRLLAGRGDKRSWARRGETIQLTVVSFTHRGGGFSGEGTGRLSAEPRSSGSTVYFLHFSLHAMHLLSLAVHGRAQEDITGSEFGLIYNCWCYLALLTGVPCSMRRFYPMASSKIQPSCSIGACIPAQVTSRRVHVQCLASLQKYATNQIMKMQQN